MVVPSLFLVDISSSFEGSLFFKAALIAVIGRLYWGISSKARNSH